MSAKKQLLAQYDLHHILFNNVIADISDEESDRVVLPLMNTVKWLAGHLLWDQGSLARIGGAQVIIPWAGRFMSVEGATDDDLNAPECEMPTLAMIKDKWNEIAPSIREGLNSLTDEALDRPVEFPMRLFKTLADSWAFANHHQAYTIGQIGILRRPLDKEAMKYG